MLKYSEIEEGKFIPIINFVLEDNAEIKKLKSIYQKEEEYSTFLGPIESFIAYYFYYDDKKLKDVDVKKAIRNIVGNLDKNINFFKTNFEKELAGVIEFTLEEQNKKITKHELLLVLRYISWCIDNREWLNHSQAYLNWVCGFFGLSDQDGDGDDKSSNEDEESEFWEEGGFIQSMGQKDIDKKMKSFHMKHNEDVNYNCRKCNKKISLHNKDWHKGLCDGCFDKGVYGGK